MDDLQDRTGDAEAVIAALRPAALARTIGTLTILGFGAGLVWAGLFGGQDEGGAAGRPTLVLLGAAGIGAGIWLWRATRTALELTQAVLRETSGRILARVEDIRAVDRGAFSFKPSGGFVLRLEATQPSAWRPGLWWRFGNRIGVGGVTTRRETRQMADALALLVARRSS